MQLITKKYRHLFAESYEWSHFLILEIISVLGIIGFLVSLNLKAGIEHIYKTVHAQLLPNYTVTARFEQHQHYAWNGNFNNVSGSKEYDSGDRQSNLHWNNNITRIELSEYRGIPKHFLTIKLNPQHGATLTPNCGETDLPFHLLPYNCKIEYYYE